MWTEPLRAADASFRSISEPDRLALLCEQIDHARTHCRFYREKLRALPLPETFDQLQCYPLISAEELSSAGTDAVCVTGSSVARIVSLPTSGTTGPGKRIYFTEKDLARTAGFFADGMAWICGKGDRVGIFLPGTSPDGLCDLLARGLRRIGAEPVMIGAFRTPAEVLPQLRETPCSVYVGMPWQMRLLALAAPELRPRAVLLSADAVPASLPALLKSQWGCTVTRHFGMTETGYGCAVEHPDAPGMLLRLDEFFAEIVDPVTLEPLPFGKPGELVLTSLRREAMPLIRYRTGDLAVMRDGGCISEVFGRISVTESRVQIANALCALPWIYDYSAASDGINVQTSINAPQKAAEILREICGGRVHLMQGEAQLFTDGKHAV